MLPTGYRKSLVFHVLPRLLKERDARVSSQSVGSSVVVIISPLNALMYDQISKLRERGVKAAVLGVKVRRDEEGDSVLDSKWEGNRGSIIEAGYKIVFCHPESFLSCKDGIKVLQSPAYQNAVKATVVDEAHCILEW